MGTSPKVMDLFLHVSNVLKCMKVGMLCVLTCVLVTVRNN